jgi:hypothetical protein
MLDDSTLRKFACDRFLYLPETGQFLWKVSRPHIKVGDAAGCLTPTGYVLLSIDDVKYKAHRIAWLIAHGSLPKIDIDHINGDRSDNRISNLRAVSRQINLQNMRHANRLNKSGLLGVSPNHKRWAASIRINGKKKHIGTFDTPNEAQAAYAFEKAVAHEGFVAERWAL